MKITYLKNDIRFVPEVSKYMFEEWGDIYSAKSFMDIVCMRLNIENIPLTIIASENNNLLGFASLVKSDFQINTPLTPWISGVFVLPKYRKLGIGKALVKELENISAYLGYSKLYLS